MFKNFFKSDKKPSPKDVGEFYDCTTDAFIATHGDVIQSFRTYNINDYLDYTIESAKLTDNLTILDAGCGVGGPSIYFAKKVRSTFHGVTISSVQAKIAQEKIIKDRLEERVHICHADYHDIEKIFGRESFDRVLFLESFGHSQTQIHLLELAWNVLKPGGILYIKDLFERESVDPFEQKRIKEVVHTINTSYKFNIGDLHPVLSRIRTLNFILEFIKIPEIDFTQLDRFQVSSEFQNITQIGLDPSKEDLVFPVDYLEIRCKKPAFDPKKDREVYYLTK